MGCFGQRTKDRHVAQSIQRALAFRFELLTEVIRVLNMTCGALVEFTRSDFPADANIELPERSWFAKRVDVDTTNVWLPKGGGAEGTVLVQESKVDVEFQLPHSLIKYIMYKVAPEIVTDFRRSVQMASEPGAN